MGMVVNRTAPPMTSGFAAIKRAIEASYDCIGITCEDVGGILLPARERLSGKTYVTGAEPCGDASMVSSSADSGDDDDTFDTLQTASHAMSQSASGMLQTVLVTIAIVHM